MIQGGLYVTIKIALTTVWSALLMCYCHTNGKCFNPADKVDILMFFTFFFVFTGTLRWFNIWGTCVCECRSMATCKIFATASDFHLQIHGQSAYNLRMPSRKLDWIFASQVSKARWQWKPLWLFSITPHTCDIYHVHCHKCDGIHDVLWSPTVTVTHLTFREWSCRSDIRCVIHCRLTTSTSFRIATVRMKLNTKKLMCHTYPDQAVLWPPWTILARALVFLKEKKNMCVCLCVCV